MEAEYKPEKSVDYSEAAGLRNRLGSINPAAAERIFYILDRKAKQMGIPDDDAKDMVEYGLGIYFRGRGPLEEGSEAVKQGKALIGIVQGEFSTWSSRNRKPGESYRNRPGQEVIETAAAISRISRKDLEIRLRS